MVVEDASEGGAAEGRGWRVQVPLMECEFWLWVEVHIELITKGITKEICNIILLPWSSFPFIP